MIAGTKTADWLVYVTVMRGTRGDDAERPSMPGEPPLFLVLTRFHRNVRVLVKELNENVLASRRNEYE